MNAAGLSWEEIAEIYDKYAELDADETMNASEKAVQMAHWLDSERIPTAKQQIAEEYLGFWSMRKAEPTRYNKFVDAGLNENLALEINDVLAELEPEEGKSDVSARQKYKAIADKKLKEADAMKAYGVVMGESEYKKLQAANDLALDPNVYAEVKYLMPEYDENGNGSYSNAEIEAAIKAYAKGNRHVDNGDKALLWQMLTGNTSAKNNPFSKSLAKRYLDALDELKKGEE